MSNFQESDSRELQLVESSISDGNEWASEGEQKLQYASRREYSVIKFSICQYAMSGYANTKPGGTAGVLLLSLQKKL